MKRYTFKIKGWWPDRVEQCGETRSKARYMLWLRFSEAYPCTFSEFMRRCT